MVFLYYVILKLNCSFLSSNAFSSDRPEVVSANFLFHRFETCSLNDSCDVLSQSLKILDLSILKITTKSGQWAKFGTASNSEYEVAYKISLWTRYMNWKNHKFDFEVPHEPTVLRVKHICFSLCKEKIQRGQVGEWAKSKSLYAEVLAMYQIPEWILELCCGKSQHFFFPFLSISCTPYLNSLWLIDEIPTKKCL